MTAREKLMKLLLLASLLPTGARCANDTVFVYSTLGGEALLPCMHLTPRDCSTINWTFFKGGKEFQVEVRGGQVVGSSRKARRITVTSNCSMILRDLVVEDAASYVCERDGRSVTAVYLSLLAISSPSSITQLRSGGQLALSCILSTYYDAGSCTDYSAKVFSVRWLQEDGAEVRDGGRYRLIRDSHCNTTLITHLQADDDNRRWTCQVNTTESSRDAFLDFKASFLIQNAPSRQIPPAVSQDCSGGVPISRIVLCGALPLMVGIVGFYTWRVDHRRAKGSAAGIELSEIH